MSKKSVVQLCCHEKFTRIVKAITMRLLVSHHLKHNVSMRSGGYYHYSFLPADTSQRAFRL